MPEATTPVTPEFSWVQSQAGHALISSALSPLASHLFSTRDLGFRGGAVDPDYARLARAFGVEETHVVRVRQVHGKAILEIHPGVDAASVPDADAIVSTDPARVIAVRVADCVPVLMADRQHRAVAAVHAGWRGTAAGIAAATVARLRRLGVSPEDLVAVIGPSIGPCCYQVDGAVKDAFADAPGESAAWFAADGPGKWKLDLWMATVDQLTAAGVPRASVHVARLCTSDHPDRFYSYRRGDRETGRMVAAVRLGRPSSAPA
ncbi:MAG: peptidoglycan editing factor PgeF [Acidobacteriota bacterium]